MTKPLLLLIDSSNQQCSIALSEGDQIVASADAIEPGSYIHAEQLHVLIQEVMTHHAFDQLDGIVISNGPGSYTGLRIGMSSAKGLAYALDIPLKTFRFRKGIRSQDVRHRHRLSWRPPPERRCGGSPRRRVGRPRRPRPRRARLHLRRRTPRCNAGPWSGRCGTPDRRSRRGWQRVPP